MDVRATPRLRQWRGAQQAHDDEGSGMAVGGFRLRAACGILGPLAFTGAWVAGSLRQAGHSMAEVQLSGLAAPDANDPGIMVAGFVVLGGCTVAFGSAVEEALGGRGRAGPAPRLIRASGAAMVAAGLLRRDRMLLDPPGVAVAAASWHNHLHDLASLVAYGASIAGPLLLARRFAGDPNWAPLRRPLLASALATGAAMALFVSPAMAPWAGIVQRVMVTIPLAGMLAIASRLLGAGTEATRA
jgi:hypothetical protein